MHRALKILAYRVVTNIALYELNLPVECIDGLFRAATRCGQILLYWNFTTVFPTAQINFVISGRVFEVSGGSATPKFSGSSKGSRKD